MGDAPAEVVTRHTSRLESARASSAEKEVCDELPARYLSAFRARLSERPRSPPGAGEGLLRGGPLDPRSARLVKLGVAIGAQAEGAVRSHARRALARTDPD